MIKPDCYVLSALLGVLIKLYDDIVDMKIKISSLYVFFLKCWIVLITQFVISECPTIGVLALFVIFSSFCCGRIDDMFWYQYTLILFVFTCKYFQKISTSGINILLFFLTAINVAYEEIGFPEEISKNKIKARMGIAIITCIMLLFFINIDFGGDTTLLILFLLFGQGYTITSVINLLSNCTRCTIQPPIQSITRIRAAASKSFN
jgi:hypothetical protein